MNMLSIRELLSVGLMKVKNYFFVVDEKRFDYPETASCYCILRIFEFSAAVALIDMFPC